MLLPFLGEMIQFDFLEISGSIPDFQTRKKMRILADSPKFCQKYHVFTPIFGAPPGKKRHEFPQRMSDRPAPTTTERRKKRDGTSPQVVSALCFCMDLRPVKSHPTLGGELVGWVSFASPSVTSDSLVGEIFFVWGNKNG